MKTLKDIKPELLANPATQAAYESQAAKFEMARELFAARSSAGLTQSDIAQRMGTASSVIARLEGGKRIPSMRTVQRYGQAVKTRAVVRLGPQAERARLPVLPRLGRAAILLKNLPLRWLAEAPCNRKRIR